MSESKNLKIYPVFWVIGDEDTTKEDVVRLFKEPISLTKTVEEYKGWFCHQRGRSFVVMPGEAVADSAAVLLLGSGKD